jgi:hypothetical protein
MGERESQGGMKIKETKEGRERER